MSRRETILIVDDEEAIRTQLYWGLRDAYDVLQAPDGDRALEQIGAKPVDLVLLDLRFPPDTSGISGGKKILDEIVRVRPDVPVIVMTGDQDRETAVEMVALGAFDFFRKPVKLDELRVIVRRALRMRRLEREVRQLRSQLATDAGIEGLVGRSPAMREVVRLVRRVADSNATVLVRGESGTGKELVARALHRLSSRRDAAFVALNCSAIPASLIDDELFGHEKGAFTGAGARRHGKFEYATGGTLFLDEVGDLPEPVQIKLLRVLQESEIQRIGGNDTIPVDVRLITATHQDLEAKCREGTFREDFYYRLNVVTIPVPPLRDRSGDVALLAEHFLDKHGGPGGPGSLSPDASEALRGHDWPGNVRQLENLIHSLCVTCERAVIEVGDLPEEFRGETRAADPLPGELPDEGMDLATVEKELIRRTLEAAAGNKSRAARMLGLSRHVLLNKLRKHGID